MAFADRDIQRILAERLGEDAFRAIGEAFSEDCPVESAPVFPRELQEKIDRIFRLKKRYEKTEQELYPLYAEGHRDQAALKACYLSLKNVSKEITGIYKTISRAEIKTLPDADDKTHKTLAGYWQMMMDHPEFELSTFGAREYLLMNEFYPRSSLKSKIDIFRQGLNWKRGKYSSAYAQYQETVFRIKQQYARDGRVIDEDVASADEMARSLVSVFDFAPMPIKIRHKTSLEKFKRFQLYWQKIADHDIAYSVEHEILLENFSNEDLTVFFIREVWKKQMDESVKQYRRLVSDLSCPPAKACEALTVCCRLYEHPPCEVRDSDKVKFGVFYRKIPYLFNFWQKVADPDDAFSFHEKGQDDAYALEKIFNEEIPRWKEEVLNEFRLKRDLSEEEAVRLENLLNRLLTLTNRQTSLITKELLVQDSAKKYTAASLAVGSFSWLLNWMMALNSLYLIPGVFTISVAGYLIELARSKETAATDVPDILSPDRFNLLLQYFSVDDVMTMLETTCEQLEENTIKLESFSHRLINAVMRSVVAVSAQPAFMLSAYLTHSTREMMSDRNFDAGFKEVCEEKSTTWGDIGAGLSSVLLTLPIFGAVILLQQKIAEKTAPTTHPMSECLRGLRV